jgi:plasmid stabilization system protein ParE
LLTVAPERADEVVTLLGLSTRVLAEFPRLGRMLPEFEHEWLREIIVENYRIVYEILDDAVAIVVVYHATMDVEARLRRDRPDL